MKTQLTIDRPHQPEMRHWSGSHHAGVSDRTISSSDLFDGRREIGIEHHGAYYRLKITRQGKLILNK